MSKVAERRAWSIARFPEAGSMAFAVVVWLAVVVLTVIIAAVITSYKEVTGSIWEPLTQLPRWFAFGTGIWLTGVYLRVHVAHGQTRRDFMRQGSVYIVAISVLVAVLTTLSYLIELGIYRIFGWPQDFSRDYLFDSAGQVGPILLTYVLVYLVWTVVGAMIAATFLRLYWYGLVVMVPLGVALIIAVEIAVGARYFGPLDIVADIGIDGSVPLALVAGIGGFAIALAATWALVRELPFCGDSG